MKRRLPLLPFYFFLPTCLVFAFLFLALLLLAARLRAIPASCFRMISSHLGMARFHLGMLSTYLSVPRHLLIHRVLPVSRTAVLGSFTGVCFGLVSPVSVIFGLELVPTFSSVTCSCSLKISFGYVPRFVFTFSRSKLVSFCAYALTLPRAFALVE